MGEALVSVGVLGFLAMAPWDRTGSSVSTRALAKSVNVSENASKILGESTHPIGSTRLINMMMPSSPRDNGMIYANAPTWEGRRVTLWYASVTSIFETRTGPWTWLASQTDCSMQVRAITNYINPGATSLYIVSLTLCVNSSVFYDSFRISHS